MATATKQTTPPTPPVEVIESVTLVMSEDEARAVLRYLGDRVSDTTTSPVYYALANLLDPL